jgi:hypothetical protein
MTPRRARFERDCERRGDQGRGARYGRGWRLRAMIVVLWRAGLRVHEALRAR